LAATPVKSDLSPQGNSQHLHALLLAAVICIFLLCGMVAFQCIQHIRLDSDLVGQTAEDLRATDQIRSSSRDAESDQAYFAALLATLITTLTGMSLAAIAFLSLQDRRKRIEVASADLLCERKQWQAAFASLSDCVIVCDRDCCVTFLNPASESLTGWADSVARGLPITEVFKSVAEDGGGTGENSAARAVREGSIVELVQHRLLISRSGQKIPIEESALPIWDARQNISGGVLVFREVTERSSAEERLPEAFEFARSIVDTLGELVVVLDQDMQVLHVNRAFSMMSQLTDDRILGRSIYQIDEGQWDLPAVHQLLEGSSIQPHIATQIEIEQQRSHIDRRFFRLTARTFTAGIDHRKTLLLIIADVTAERVLDEQSRCQDAPMRWALDQLRDYAVFCVDVDCKATSWNQGVRQVLGFEEDEFVGRDIRKLIFTREAQAAGIAETEFSRAALDQAASDDCWMIKKGGEEFWASGITTGLRSRDGRLIGYCKVIRDLTSAKRVHEEHSELAIRLSGMDPRRNQFLATLAHELRNPLAPIKNAVQLMGMLKLDPEIDQLREMMSRQVEQLVRLIDDLLEVSRISLGKISLRSEIVELSAIIDAAVEASSTIIAEHGQQLIVNVREGDVIRINGDPLRLIQVFSNLLENSAKYSNPGSRIELTVVLEEHTAVVSVRDFGIGIAPEILQRIVHTFSQSSDMLEQSNAGLGIGLTLVKTLVELHGGTVVAQSEGVGKGSTFVVRLPSAADHSSSNVTAPANRSAVSVRSFKVLIVEDMRALRVITARLLEKLGHEVEIVENGAMALLKLETFTPDVIFSDIAMPTMTGYELAQRIRQRPDCSQVCLVALTGFGQSSDREKAIEAGFHEHMVKPVDITALQSLFEKLSRSAAV
jgi:PAS domain S-box-containing protein